MLNYEVSMVKEIANFTGMSFNNECAKVIHESHAYTKVGVASVFGAIPDWLHKKYGSVDYK